MGHVGEKFGFGAIGGLGGIAGAEEVFFEPHAVGDIETDADLADGDALVVADHAAANIEPNGVSAGEKDAAFVAEDVDFFAYSGIDGMLEADGVVGVEMAELVPKGSDVVKFTVGIMADEIVAKHVVGPDADAGGVDGEFEAALHFGEFEGAFADEFFEAVAVTLELVGLAAELDVGFAAGAFLNPSHGGDKGEGAPEVEFGFGKEGENDGENVDDTG